MRSPTKRRADDDDDDDRRTKRKRPAKPKNSALPWILGGILGGGALLVLACGGVGILLLVMGRGNRAPDPQGLPFAQLDPRIEPGGRPVAPANILQAASIHFSGEALGDPRDMAFAPQASGVGYLYWDMNAGLKKYFDYWNFKTAKRLARIELPDDGDYLSLSPQGTRFLVQKNLKLHVWSLPDGQPLFKEWSPYPGGQAGFKAPRLFWASYVDENRLLTLSATRQFDLWDMTTKKALYSSPAPARFVGLTVDGFARAPREFTLSPDRKKLALPNGAGFDFFDTLTGKKLGSTKTDPAQGLVGNIWSVSFNRDGTLFASKGNLFLANKQQEYITVWEVPSGVRKQQFPLAQEFMTNGPMHWLGPRHLLIMDGNRFKGYVFSLVHGRFQRVCNLNAGERFASCSPDERIWYSSRAAFGAPQEVVAVVFPEQDVAQRPAPPVANLRDLPPWSFTTAGIVRTGPGAN